MKLADNNWFTEHCVECGSAFSMMIKAKLHEEQTPYQKIEIYQTETFGRLMTLDQLVMLTDRDHFIYHEMMTHPAIFSHPDPKRVLVIGGGDCGSLHEVLKHRDIERVEQIELDERVTRVSEEYFPALCQSNHDPRAHFQFIDGIEWVRQADTGIYDIIIIDSTDPVGLAVGLFTENFYRNCFQALAADGVLIAQSESPLFHLDIMKRMRANMSVAGFPNISTLHFPQCSYPSGWWTATLAAKTDCISDFRRPVDIAARIRTKYYTSEVHQAALTLPVFLADALRD